MPAHAPIPEPTSPAAGLLSLATPTSLLASIDAGLHGLQDNTSGAAREVADHVHGLVHHLADLITPGALRPEKPAEEQTL